VKNLFVRITREILRFADFAQNDLIEGGGFVIEAAACFVRHAMLVDSRIRSNIPRTKSSGIP
jgi:hypothetical protein